MTHKAFNLTIILKEAIPCFISGIIQANKIKPQQEAYIESWMDEFEALFSNNYTNSIGNRYTDYINLNSFTDFLLINEFSKNSDGYKLSSYVHKDSESKGKARCGPIGTLIRPTAFL